MIEITVKGTVTVDGMKFHGIEGGFGQSKKSMLVKEIAAIHNQPLSEINRRINDNRGRFIDGVDIVDIKANGFEPLGRSLGYTKQSFNQSTNIYALSERGYAKLLKILEDDVAWEKYDQLVDGYFTMRKVVKENPATLEAIRVESAKERARAMLLNAQNRAFKTLMRTIDDKKLSPIAAEVFGLTALEQLTGQKISYRPQVAQTWSATDLSNETGVSPITLGKIATQRALNQGALFQAIPFQSSAWPERCASRRRIAKSRREPSKTILWVSGRNRLTAETAQTLKMMTIRMNPMK